MALALAITALVAVVIHAAASGSRYRRLARRLKRESERSGRLRGEILPLIRPLWTDLIDRRGSAGTRHADALPITSRGEQGEDLVLLALFVAADGDRMGSFIEAGGYDGRTNSPTWLLESIGWQGLLVEPSPKLAALARGRRNSVVVEAALGRRGCTGTAELVAYEPTDPNRPTDLASHLAGADSGKSTPDERNAQRVRVPLRALGDVLRDHQDLAPLDLLVLDVEGGELDALDGLDLDHNRPRIILIEDHGGSASQHDLLQNAGYRYVCRFDFNRLYIRSDEDALLAAAKDRLALDQVDLG